MFQSYFAAWKKPFDFKSRTGRKEYWYFYLLNIFPFIFLRIIQGVLGNIAALSLGDFGGNGFISGFLLVLIKTLGIFSTLFLLGIMWTSIPLTVRRIRDVGMSWRWIFLAKLPIFGEIFALIFLTRTSIKEIDGKNYYLKH